MIIRPMILGALLLTTICEAQEHIDPISTTTDALKKQYAKEIQVVTKRLERKGEFYLEEWGMGRYYVASTGVIVKILLENKIVYHKKLDNDFSWGGETTNKFDGVMFFIKKEF